MILCIISGKNYSIFKKAKFLIYNILYDFNPVNFLTQGSHFLIIPIVEKPANNFKDSILQRYFLTPYIR